MGNYLRFFIFLLTLALSQAGTCKYSLKRNQYHCDLEYAFKLLDESELEISGDHLPEYSDEDVKVISIRLSVIHYLRRTIFDKFPNLEEFNTYDMEIFQISPDAFTSCKELQMIFIEDEDLESLPSRIFANCSKLREVTIRNKLKTIPSDAFEGATSIEKLDLSSNQLEQIPVLSGFLIRLNHLNLAENNLRNLPSNAISTLIELKKIEMRKNHLSVEDVPGDFFKNLENLEHLDLSDNALSYLKPAWFLDLKNLSVLDIAYNYIEALEGEIFAPLTSLRVLYLDHNNLIELNSNSFDFHQIMRILTVDSNFITKIERNFFTKFPNLAYFSANGNKCMSTFIAGVNQQPINFTDQEVLKKLENCFETPKTGFPLYFIWIGLGIAAFICMLFFALDWYLGKNLQNKSYSFAT